MPSTAPLLGPAPRSDRPLGPRQSHMAAHLIVDTSIEHHITHSQSLRPSGSYFHIKQPMRLRPGAMGEGVTCSFLSCPGELDCGGRALSLSKVVLPPSQSPVVLRAPLRKAALSNRRRSRYVGTAHSALGSWRENTAVARVWRVTDGGWRGTNSVRRGIHCSLTVIRAVPLGPQWVRFASPQLAPAAPAPRSSLLSVGPLGGGGGFLRVAGLLARQRMAS